MSDWIEQAIFTSAETDRACGYQVIAASPGVCDADQRELAAWGPSHDALLESAPNVASFNFHPLPSGRYCLSRTTPAGWEYSGRGAIRVYTQCLLLPPTVLERFANNPFAVARAALAGGIWRVYEKLPDRLAPFELPGRANLVDEQLLARLAKQPGPEWMAALVQAALDAVSFAVAGGPPAEHLIAGLINCLPESCRTEFSFSTGLRFSAQRPFRIVALSQDGDEQRRIERAYKLSVLRIDKQPPPELAPVEGWSRLVYQVFKTGRTSYFARQLAQRAGAVELTDLPALGLELIEQCQGGRAAGPPHRSTETRPRAGGRHREFHAADPAPLGGTASTEAAGQQLACDPQASVAPRRTGPSQLLAVDHPEVREKLERLDDLVYDAMAGKEAAADELREYWPHVRVALGEELLAESCEQYLRYAMSLWDECIGPEGVRQSSRTARSLEILCLMFEQVA